MTDGRGDSNGAAIGPMGQPWGQPSGPPQGEFIRDNELDWYQIDEYDLLDPFLVNVVSPDDHWMFVSTSGAITTGRQSAEHSLFAYETDDRLHRSGGRVGPVTIIRVGSAPGAAGHGDGGGMIWRPFSTETPIGRVRRTLAKSTFGDRLRFTEHNPDYGLTFHYTWATAGRFGVVRHCELVLDDGRDPLEVELLDGLIDVLPAGVELETQQASSTLVDAYRRSELCGPADLALFTLEALISDQADPAESLRANVVWSQGLPGSTVALSDNQIRRFVSGYGLEAEHLVTGRKGAHLQAASVSIEPGQPARWATVADVGYDHVQLSELQDWLSRTGIDSRWAEVLREIDASHKRLSDIAVEADGHQLTADKRATVHHFANVLFNAMRGGVFLDDHRVEVDAVGRLVVQRNRALASRFADAVAALDGAVEIGELRLAVANDSELLRLVNEYLPLTFSRRHGDPSRPWNTFRIPAQPADGSNVIGYEGNWRDIFQNWEALLHSFPNYIESVVSKFLSASTLDGHNPYRITDQGIDWEQPEDGSWGNFGYWGDHQIVYLHRLLAMSQRFHPGVLESKLGQRAFSSADVPYRIRPYASLVDDPKNTIDFDHEHQDVVLKRVAEVGADGRLVPAAGGGGVHLVTLAEKLMIPALAKISNLVAGGGIWMNTQRPEWNDANNALVGNGVSVVTLFHLRHYLQFVDQLLAGVPGLKVEIDGSVLVWMSELDDALRRHEELGVSGSVPISPSSRRELLDELGGAYSRYRERAYDDGPGVGEQIDVGRLRSFIAIALPHLDRAAIEANGLGDPRDDVPGGVPGGVPSGLVHTYQLLHLEEGAAHLVPLYEMLEGQVASLVGGAVGGGVELSETTSRLDALYRSEMYRDDQKSFVLYPDKLPPSFLAKNQIDEKSLGSHASALLDADVGAALDSDLLARDADGILRFAPGLVSPRALETELDRLAVDAEVGSAVEAARHELTAAYQAVFNHRAFTGRSQTMHRYEGLGSVYWHMVSKLLLTVQEQIVRLSADGVESDLNGVDRAEVDETVARLVGYYRRIRDGLGFNKTVVEQGGFPTDPHSHTPAHTGAQQPGMTGQVKEGVLIRWGELGVTVVDGRVEFRPVLLSIDEFLTEAEAWPILGADAMLLPGSLGFTFCGVPVIYRLEGSARLPVVGRVEVTMADGSVRAFGTRLDPATSDALFSRTNRVTRLDVGVNRAELLL